MTDAQPVGLLASIRGAMRTAEKLWSDLNNLRHEVSACDGLSPDGASDIGFKLKLAANSLGEAVSIMFAAASNRQSASRFLTEQARAQLDDLHYGKL